VMVLWKRDCWQAADVKLSFWGVTKTSRIKTGKMCDNDDDDDFDISYFLPDNLENLTKSQNLRFSWGARVPTAEEQIKSNHFPSPSAR
jgi:hypothetical protein